MNGIRMAASCDTCMSRNTYEGKRDTVREVREESQTDTSVHVGFREIAGRRARGMGKAVQ